MDSDIVEFILVLRLESVVPEALNHFCVFVKLRHFSLMPPHYFKNAKQKFKEQPHFIYEAENNNVMPYKDELHVIGIALMKVYLNLSLCFTESCRANKFEPKVII